MLSNEELTKLSHLGFLVGPGEEEEAYLSRSKACLCQEEIPRSPEGNTLIQEASQFTFAFAKFAPTWVPILLTKEKLLPWHGGAATIYKKSEDSPRCAFLQIRPGGALFYTPLELTKHELVHVARMQFDEPRFEEILAYRVASNRFTRFFGPLFRSPLFVNLFVLTLFLILFVDFLALALQPDLYLSLLPLKILPLLMLFYALAMLIVDQRTLKRALSHLEEALGNKEKARAVLFRLTDKEISLFSKSTKEEILAYKENEPSLRWREISSILSSL